MSIDNDTCPLLELPRVLLILIAGHIVEHKTSESVRDFVNFGSTCTWLHQVVASQHTLRLLCAYEKPSADFSNSAFSLDGCLSLDVVQHAIEKQNDWRTVFVDKYRRECRKCHRKCWSDETARKTKCKPLQMHEWRDVSSGMVREALAEQDRRVKQFVIDSKKEQSHLLMNFDTSKFDKYKETESLASSQDWS